MANIYDMIDTWNDGATTFTAIKMNVTDTASAAASLLMDLQVGGVSRFSVGKGAGAIFGANLIEQRNSTNAQTFNLYNTYTDASNYERGFMKWNANVLQIGTEAAGTGASRIVSVLLNSDQNKIQGGTNQVRLFAGGGEYLRVGIATWSMPLWASGSGLKIETSAQGGNTDRAGDPIIIDCKGGSGAGDAGYISLKAAKTLASGITAHTSVEVMRIAQNTSDQAVVIINSLPTTNPANAGQLWNDAGTLKISAGV